MASAERPLFADAVFLGFFVRNLSGADAYTTVGHATDRRKTESGVE